MEPLNDQDPISKLLAKSRPIQPRGNFTQNVLREARQTPQDAGWFRGILARLSDRLSTTPALRLAGAAAVLALASLAWFSQHGPQSELSPTVVNTAPPAKTPVEKTTLSSEIPLVPEVETQWQNLDHLDALLAVEDTSTLSDSEVAFFLY